MEGNVASTHVNWRVTKIVMLEFCKTFIKESSNLAYPSLNLLSTIALWIPHVSAWKDIFLSIRKQQYLITSLGQKLGADEADFRQVCSIV